MTPLPHGAVTRGTDRVRCLPLACELSAASCASRHVAREAYGHRVHRDPRAFARYGCCATCRDGATAHARLGLPGTPGAVPRVVIGDVDMAGRQSWRGRP